MRLAAQMDRRGGGGYGNPCGVQFRGVEGVVPVRWGCGCRGVVAALSRSACFRHNPPTVLSRVPPRMHQRLDLRLQCAI